MYRIDDDGGRGPSRVRRLVAVGLFVSASMICGLVEARFPLPFPGVRLGVSNIFYLLALTLFGAPEAICTAALRVLLLFAMTGNAFASVCSVSGLALSLSVSIFLYKNFDREVSLKAISVASACAFNLGQLSAVVLMTGEKRMFIYYPILLAVGCATGYAVGAVASNLRDRLERLI